MKKYDQFLNENTVTGKLNSGLPIGFKFIIDFSDSTGYQVGEFFTEIKKYFNVKDKNLLYFTTFYNYLIFDSRSIYRKVSFKISLIFTGDLELKFEIDYGSSSSSGRDLETTSNTITLQEFLMVGFEGVKNFVKMKNNASKYNI